MAPSSLRLAVVSGAGSGLGRAFCLRLAAAGGHHVVAIDADEIAGQETVAAMRRLPSAPAAEFVRLDVTDCAAWRQLADRLADDCERARVPAPDVLINNAGVCAAAETLTSDPDQWRRIMEVNFFGVLNGCQALGPLWLQHAALRPRIINVASIAAFLPGPSMGAYSASKAAVVALSEALYAELRPAGVGVTVVAPGFFRTGLLERGAFCTPRHRAQAEKLSREATFTADDVARIALAASSRRQLYAIMGRRARWLCRLKRVAPTTLMRLVSRNYRRTFGVGGEAPRHD